jgi:hypothetical protein
MVVEIWKKEHFWQFLNKPELKKKIGIKV